MQCACSVNTTVVQKFKTAGFGYQIIRHTAKGIQRDRGGAHAPGIPLVGRGEAQRAGLGLVERQDQSRPVVADIVDGAADRVGLERAVLVPGRRDEAVGGPNPFRWEDFAVRQAFAGKKVVVFAVPGAFTPTCTLNHLPGYLENRDALMARGVDAIAVVSAFIETSRKAYQYTTFSGTQTLKSGDVVHVGSNLGFDPEDPANASKIWDGDLYLYKVADGAPIDLATANFNDGAKWQRLPRGDLASQIPEWLSQSFGAGNASAADRERMEQYLEKIRGRVKRDQLIALYLKTLGDSESIASALRVMKRVNLMKKEIQNAEEAQQEE